MIPAGVDCKGEGISAVFYLDGKRFIGFDAQRYLRDECGFTNVEAIQYLILLAASN